MNRRSAHRSLTLFHVRLQRQRSTAPMPWETEPPMPSLIISAIIAIIVIIAIIARSHGPGRPFRSRHSSKAEPERVRCHRLPLPAAASAAP